MNRKNLVQTLLSVCFIGGMLNLACNDVCVGCVLSEADSSPFDMLSQRGGSLPSTLATSSLLHDSGAALPLSVSLPVIPASVSLPAIPMSQAPRARGVSRRSHPVRVTASLASSAFAVPAEVTAAHPAPLQRARAFYVPRPRRLQPMSVPSRSHLPLPREVSVGEISAFIAASRPPSPVSDAPMLPRLRQVASMGLDPAQASTAATSDFGAMGTVEVDRTAPLEASRNEDSQSDSLATSVSEVAPSIPCVPFSWEREACSGAGPSFLNGQ